MNYICQYINHTMNFYRIAMPINTKSHHKHAQGSVKNTCYILDTQKGNIRFQCRLHVNIVQEKTFIKGRQRSGCQTDEITCFPRNPKHTFFSIFGLVHFQEAVP